MIRRSSGVTIVLVLASATALAAHDTWILPSEFHAQVGQRVRLSLTSGMLFPADDFAIKIPRIARADVRVSNTMTHLSTPNGRKMATVFDWQPKEAGIATILVELHPKTLTLKRELVDEYFDEIDASPQMRAEWKAKRPPTQWRELYVKHAKSFVRVGAPGADTSWRVPISSNLEIIPERDPTTLRVGETLVVRMMDGGKPRRNFAVGAIATGESKATFTRTDGDGRARILLRKSGRLLLNGTDLRPSKRATLEWESDFVTLTLFVAP